MSVPSSSRDVWHNSKTAKQCPHAGVVKKGERERKKERIYVSVGMSSLSLRGEVMMLSLSSA